MPRTSFFLCLIPVILFGAIAGFFYAYSVSVMPGLNFLDPKDAIYTMQNLNYGTRNALFLFTFLFTPIICAGLAFILLLIGEKPAGTLLFLAIGIYFAGSFIPTISISVPMNHAIEALDASTLSTQEALKVWQNYSADWAFWNSVRTIMALCALGFSGAAIYRIRPVCLSSS